MCSTSWVTIAVTAHGELVGGVCAVTESSVGVRWLRRMAWLEARLRPVMLSLPVHVGGLLLLLLGVLHHAEVVVIIVLWEIAVPHWR